jgi:hypothetical protein
MTRWNDGKILHHYYLRRVDAMNVYIIHDHTLHKCSVCGHAYTHSEYNNKYSLRQRLTTIVKCDGCGAIFSDSPKRCYCSDDACTEKIFIDGVAVCAQQERTRKHELLSWGYYYNCKYYKEVK